MKTSFYISLLDRKKKYYYFIGKVLKRMLDVIPFFSELHHNQIILSIITDELSYRVHAADNLFVLAKRELKLFLRKNSSDLDVFYQVLYCKEYKPVTDFISNQLKLKVHTIIDIGANIGLSSIFFHEKFPEARIIAVEPDVDNFQILTLNTSKLEKIELLNCAIWESNGFLSKSNNFRDGRNWSTSFNEPASTTDNDLINGITLSDLFLKFSIDSVSLLKIDVEGAERVIFSNYTNTDFLNHVDVLALEIHDEVSDRLLIQKILKEHHFLIIDYNETTLAFKKHLIQ